MEHLGERLEIIILALSKVNAASATKNREPNKQNMKGKRNGEDGFKKMLDERIEIERKKRTSEWGSEVHK